MKKLLKASIALSMVFGMAACGSSEPTNDLEVQTKPAEKETRNKDYNIVFTDNNVLKAEWLSVNENEYTVEITNNSGQNLQVYNGDDPLINHDKKVSGGNGLELAPDEKGILSYYVNEEDDVDCLSIEIEAAFHDGKDGDQTYIGAFCLLPKENEVVPFDAKDCEHNTHKHNNPELFKNENVTINYVATTNNYETESPVISITSNDNKPIDWWMFIMEITDDDGNPVDAYGPTSLYTFCENGVRYMTLFSSLENWEGTYHVKANSTDDQIEFSFSVDAQGNASVK